MTDVPEALLPIKISSISEIVNELRAGRIIVLVDDEDRENEGDLVMAADFVTAEAVNFMATYGRGLICLPMAQHLCERLALTPAVPNNRSRFSTGFTASIEATHGVTTGISAADRAHTILSAVNRTSTAQDIVQPGHVFPIQAVPGGVLIRAGHTEASCELAAMADCESAAVICEIMNEDGTMARLPQLSNYAAAHGLKIGTIADLIKHRYQTEFLIESEGSCHIHTADGEFMAHLFRDTVVGAMHLCLTSGQWSASDEVPVYVQSHVSMLDVLHNGPLLKHKSELHRSLARIKKLAFGAVLLMNCDEGRTTILSDASSACAYTVISPQVPSSSITLRRHGLAAQILRHCQVRTMRLIGNSDSLPSMPEFGVTVLASFPL
jgi:3,4-dihydroxy 2-butanone 4-phosphate synthase / GTP cyclohydrolase II